MFLTRSNARHNSPPLTSRIAASVNSAAMSHDSVRAPRGDEVDPLTESFIALRTSSLIACSAGAQPNRIAAATVMASENAATRVSMANVAHNGSCVVAVATIAFSSHCPSTMPAIPPAEASSRFSTSSCLTSLQRLAPMASLMPISRRRAMARASMTAATFAQATTSSSATAAAIARATVLRLLTNRSRSGWM
jgi:hypothetical protein